MRHPPRICIFTETYYPVTGGGETASRMLAQKLFAQGIDVLLLTRRSHPQLSKMEFVDGIPVYRIPLVGSQHYKKWGLLLTSFPALFRLRSRYDLIYVSGFRIIGIPAVLFGRLFHKTCILKSDSLAEMSGDYFAAGLAKYGLKPTFFLFQLFLSLRNSLLKGADAFVAISSVIEDELLAAGVPASSISRIPNSVDIDKFKPVDEIRKSAIRSKLSIPSNAIVVVYTGRLVSYKGLTILLEAWEKLQTQHNHLHLLLVGEGGDDIHSCEVQLRQYVQQNGMGSSVYFTGSVQYVHEYLQASDIFVFPTTNEAFGISVIEAMACGLPVVGTNVGGLKDIMVHGKNGLVIKPGDKTDLYQALEALILDPKLAVTLGRSACQTAQEGYRAEIVTEKYLDLFQQYGVEKFSSP